MLSGGSHVLPVLKACATNFDLYSQVQTQRTSICYGTCPYVRCSIYCAISSGSPRLACFRGMCHQACPVLAGANKVDLHQNDVAYVYMGAPCNVYHLVPPYLACFRGLCQQAGVVQQVHATQYAEYVLHHHTQHSVSNKHASAPHTTQYAVYVFQHNT
jgi:hypothetical protein